jgi:transposase-like protein
VARYSLEKREWVLRQMMPPLNRGVAELAEETGISSVTLYAWRQQAKTAGVVVPGDGKNSADWSSADKFRVVLEAAILNEVELAEYCRRKGLYVEQIQAWREACEQANATSVEQGRVLREQDKKSRQRIKVLERDLRRKESALAEAAALLILRKKAEAIWGKDEDD